MGGEKSNNSEGTKKETASGLVWLKSFWKLDSGLRISSLTQQQLAANTEQARDAIVIRGLPHCARVWKLWRQFPRQVIREKWMLPERCFCLDLGVTTRVEQVINRTQRLESLSAWMGPTCGNIVSRRENDFCLKVMNHQTKRITKSFKKAAHNRSNERNSKTSLQLQAKTQWLSLFTNIKIYFKKSVSLYR